MEQQLFLNKYQPLYFNSFESDDKIIEILNTLISMNSLNILFIGYIGSGKTTFINAVIREYYTNYSSHQYNDNVLHINSLKEQGINYYRNDVKTFCQTCSSIKGKKKIIVLDDIDLINEQSQQVFRNYIDKYSYNVHFISSCSNSQKVIEPLQSRLLPTKIKPLQRHHLNKIMLKIIDNENIVINPDAVEFILNVCNNNIKILINYIEKFKLLNQEITLNIATNVCTNICFFNFQEYTQHLKNNELYKAIQIFYNIHDKGYSVMDILDNYFLYIKTTQLLSEDEKYSIIPLICKYITIFHNIHEDEIELSLFSNNVYKMLSK
jgi:replication factor C subunit 2/4